MTVEQVVYSNEHTGFFGTTYRQSIIPYSHISREQLYDVLDIIDNCFLIRIGKTKPIKDGASKQHSFGKKVIVEETLNPDDSFSGNIFINHRSAESITHKVLEGFGINPETVETVIQ